MDQTTPPDIKALLTEMATLTTMERGKLTAEHRSRPASEGTGRVALGPYYKLQAWEEGRNVSRRVPAAEVPALQEDLANHERFTELADAFVEQTIARTRTLRSADLPEKSTDAKKNSAKKPAAKDTRKRKPSSQKSKRA